MKTDHSKPSRGRPRDPAKRRALLDAAKLLFLKLGADAVTVDLIIAAAGVSRATFYSNFSDKSAVLAAIIADQSQRVATDEWAEAAESLDVEKALVDFGNGLMELIADPSTIAFERLTGQVCQSNPELGKLLFSAGPGRALKILTRIIRRGQRGGRLKPGKARQAACDLMGLWQGMWRLEVVYDIRATPCATELAAMARHGVRQFLTIYRA